MFKRVLLIVLLSCAPAGALAQPAIPDFEMLLFVDGRWTVVSSAGEIRRYLPITPGTTAYISLSDDGSKLALIAGNWQTWEYDFRTGASRILFQADWNAASEWLPGSNTRLAFNNVQGNLYTFDTTTGSISLFQSNDVVGGRVYTRPRFTPSMSTAFFNVHYGGAGGMGVHMADVCFSNASHAFCNIRPVADPANGSFSWSDVAANAVTTSDAGKAVYFERRAWNDHAVYVHDLPGQTRRRLLEWYGYGDNGALIAGPYEDRYVVVNGFSFVQPNSRAIFVCDIESFACTEIFTRPGVFSFDHIVVARRIGGDQDPPTISAQATTSPNAAGWYNGDVTVVFTCADSGSGLASGACPADQILTAEGAAIASTPQTVTDLAGNVSLASNVVTVNIDKTPPTITASATTAPNAGGWYSGNVVVHFTCSDGGSGIPDGACPADQILSLEGAGISSLAHTVADAAGNVSAPSNIVQVNIDKTAPTLNPVVTPNPVVLNGAAGAASGAADALSGLAEHGCGTLSTGTVGNKSVTCTATDLAGNSSSQAVSYSVIYRFDGFLQPINDTAHQTCPGCPTSIFKGGSTVPVKLVLKDAAGQIVQTPSMPLWITPQQGPPTSGAVDEHEYSDPATSGAAYRWTGDHYAFNWSTKGFAVGYYWRIGVSLDDGTTRYVYIGLR